MCARSFITTVYSFSELNIEVARSSFAKPRTCLANLASLANFDLSVGKEKQVSQSLMFHWENFIGIAAVKGNLRFVLFRGKCFEVKFNLDPKHILRR